MKGWQKAFLISAFIFFAADAAIVAGDDGQLSPFEIDKLEKTKAPDFTLKNLNGKDVSLSSLKGRVVLLNFFATWCPPCIIEMPSFNRLYNEMKSRGLEVVAVSTDRSIGDVKDYANKKGLNFQILFDGGRAVTRLYKVFSMPTTFLIDRNGIILEKFFGEYDWTDTEIKKKLEKLL